MMSTSKKLTVVGCMITIVLFSESATSRPSSKGIVNAAKYLGNIITTGLVGGVSGFVGEYLAKKIEDARKNSPETANVRFDDADLQHLLAEAQKRNISTNDLDKQLNNIFYPISQSPYDKVFRPSPWDGDYEVKGVLSGQTCPGVVAWGSRYANIDINSGTLFFYGVDRLHIAKLVSSQLLIHSKFSSACPGRLDWEHGTLYQHDNEIVGMVKSGFFILPHCQLCVAEFRISLRRVH